MAGSYEAQRLRHQRAMDRRLIAEHRQLGRDVASVVLRAAQADGTLPNRRSTRAELSERIWAQVLKPYYIGSGTDALAGDQPRSAYARLLYDGVAGATRIAVAQQVALVRRVVRDEEVYRFLTGPRPANLREMQTAGRITELTVRPTQPARDALRGVDGRIDVDAARAALVRPRGTYDAWHRWVDPNGYRLSDRVWQTSINVRSRVDALLEYHIAQGTAAVDIAQEIETFLTPGARLGRTTRPYGQEGSYAARRLARTEITAAAGRAQVNAAHANPFVDGIRWRLSGSHQDADECDENAHGGPNGDGVYPPDEVPQYPNHPHELCSLVPVARRDTAEVVQSLRANIQLARGNLITGVAGEDVQRARALQGLLNPDYLLRALLGGTLDEAILAVLA